MLHPAQRICSTPAFLYYAIASSIYSYALQTGIQKQLWTGDPMTEADKAKNLEHRAVIEMVEHANHLVWIGEDKMLRVFDLQTGTLLRERELVKRACALHVDDGIIVVGDKFGDVYDYPLIPPSQHTTKDAINASDEELAKLPILGHVSMLTSVILAPRTPDFPTTNTTRSIITADRDEHIRISEFPQGHRIRHYCLLHSQFISSLFITSSGLLVAGGGDTYLSFWNPRTGNLVARKSLSNDRVQVHRDASATGGTAVLKIVEVEGKGKDGSNCLVVLVEGVSRLFLYPLAELVRITDSDSRVESYSSNDEHHPENVKETEFQEIGVIQLDRPALDVSVSKSNVWISYDTTSPVPALLVPSEPPSSSSSSLAEASSLAIPPKTFAGFVISSMTEYKDIDVDVVKMNEICAVEVEEVTYLPHNAELMRKRTKAELESARLASGKGKRKNGRGYEAVERDDHGMV